MQTATTLNNIKIEKPTAVALGFFDGVHLGHKAVIMATRLYNNGEFIPCVYTFTANSSRPKSKSISLKLATEDKKRELISNLGVEYYISPDFEEFKDLDGNSFIKDILKAKLNCSVVCCGDDFRFGRGGECTIYDLVRLGSKYNINVVVVPSVIYKGLPISSTRIRNALSNGEIVDANEMLGYNYSFSLPVERGLGLARLLNAPTINQTLPKNCLIPKYGVYRSTVVINNKEYHGLTNIGIKPTIGGIKPISETYILDFSGDIYGESVLVTLHEFIRDEKKFESLDELKSQIRIDINGVKKIDKNV